MSLKDIIKRFYSKPKSLTEEDKKKLLEEKKVQSLVKAAKLRHLIKDQTGWKEVCEIIQEVIDYSLLRKLNERTDTLDEKGIQELKYIDREVYLLNWVLKIPQQFIDKVEKTEKKEDD